MATTRDADPRDLRITTLAVPGGDLEASFAAGAGMVGCSLTHRGEELLGILGGIDAYLGRGKVFGIPLLYPWANRLGGWSYEVAGHAVALDRDSPLLHGEEHCLPIHGAVAAGSDWQVTATGTGDGAAWLEAVLDWSAHPELLAVFPFAHRVVLAIRLAGDTLRIDTTVEATGADRVPVSFGFHPYLAPAGAPRAAWEVELPALEHVLLDDRGLPTGERRALAAERFALADRTYDDLFAVAGDPVRFAVGDGVRRIVVEFESGFPYAQVFAPANQDVICFEPMTAPVDALRTHDGLRCVEPGERASAAFTVRVAAD
jgi:galactose mutarotase-like enzyme